MLQLITYIRRLNQIVKRLCLKRGRLRLLQQISGSWHPLKQPRTCLDLGSVLPSQPRNREGWGSWICVNITKPTRPPALLYPLLPSGSISSTREGQFVKYPNWNRK